MSTSRFKVFTLSLIVPAFVKYCFPVIIYWSIIWLLMMSASINSISLTWFLCDDLSLNLISTQPDSLSCFQGQSGTGYPQGPQDSGRAAVGKTIIAPEHKLALTRQAVLLGLSCCSLNYRPATVPETGLLRTRWMDLQLLATEYYAICCGENVMLSHVNTSPP